jgi:hypothetical protein
VKSRDASLTLVCGYHSGVNLKKKFTTTLRKHHRHKMEDDRAQVDLGVAVDVEERLEEAAVQRQPKKRFVGRRTAEAASSSGTIGNQEHNGAIEGKMISFFALSMYLLMPRSIKTKTDA